MPRARPGCRLAECISLRVGADGCACVAAYPPGTATELFELCGNCFDAETQRWTEREFELQFTGAAAFLCSPYRLEVSERTGERIVAAALVAGRRTLVWESAG